MKLRHADLIVVLACYCLAVFIMQFASDWMIPRLLITILLVFVLPGYTLLCAVSPQGEWDFADMLVLSIGLSLAVGVGGSLALHALRLGLYQETWLGMYFLQGCLCIVIAIVRRQMLNVHPVRHIIIPRPRLLPLIPVALAFVLIIGAWVFGSMAQMLQHQDPFTQLWAVPCKTEACDVEIGVYNHEWNSDNYRLVLMANATVIQEWDSIALRHDESWTTTVSLPAEYNTQTRLLVRLFRDEAPETPYRFVSLRYTP